MKLQAPLIGITTPVCRQTNTCCLRANYVKAVRMAGGVPILLPPEETDCQPLLERLEGLIFTGGGDIEPSAYNGVQHPTIYNVDSERDLFELNLAKLALAAEKPVLGICRGLEILVVASGGSLVAHLPDEFGEKIDHRQAELTPSEHLVYITPHSRLAAIADDTEVRVFSWHHQAVSLVPLGWRVAARACDGVVEALEHEHHPWALGLQWHPELSLQDPSQQQIFNSFVNAASNRGLVVKSTNFKLKV